MANTCFTSYVVVFKNEENANEAKAILESNEDNYYGAQHFHHIEKSFGKDIECDPRTIYRKIEVKIENGNELYLDTESAWNQDEEVRKAFETKYPDCKVYFLEDELGEGVYYSNDREHTYFQYPICVSFEATEANEGDIEYFHNREEVIERFNALYGKDCKTFEEVEKEADYLDEDNEDDYFNIYEMDYEM